MKLLVLGLFIILSSAVSANNLPTKIYSVNFPIPEFEATQKQKEEIYKNISSAIGLVANGSVFLPKSVSLYTVKNYENAFYDSYSEGIVTPYQLNVEGVSKHPKFTRGIELHEFGHSIFEANLLSIVRNNEKMFKIVNEYFKVKGQFKKEALVTVGYMVAEELAIGTEYENAIVLAHRAAENNFRDVVSSSTEKIVDTYVFSTQAFGPYHEFFADVFAVIVTQDPDVIRKAIQFTAHSGDNQSNRSFNLRPGKRVFKFSPHDFFSLSRYHIYKYYLSNPEVRKKGVRWITSKTLESIRCAYDLHEKLEVQVEKELETFKGNEERYLIERFNALLNNCIDIEFNK